VAFGHAGLDYRDHVVVDEAFFRPAEVDQLLGDPTRARTDLGWKSKVTFVELVKMMVDADISRIRKRDGHDARAVDPHPVEINVAVG
jgi:GDPmannose 4,6-dehydratase